MDMNGMDMHGMSMGEDEAGQQNASDGQHVDPAPQQATGSQQKKH
jgi:hypothetical protein